ncbi:pentapeptide repeat-containing protein [Haloplanus rubicundus]|uniref:pentapeptide repeat-containing protein n=1 Tax=Haloplanus rubicundus TaxID=1547898 RepID=UPI001300436C|nr:pentapeptide repeat-containing protein [Haloplanus rubicundus]
MEKSAEALKSACTPSETREKTSPYVELLDGANLQGVDISDDLSLENVAMRQSHASNVSISGGEFHEADFGGTDFEGAEFTNADFSSANFKETIFINADLNNVDLAAADLTNSDLSNIHFDTVNLGTATLTNANLTNAKLTKVNLGTATLANADLTDAEFDAYLGTATLTDANFANTDLSNVNLNGANLSETDLSNQDFSGTNLSGSNLRKANLSNANLAGSNLSKSDLREANIEDISVDGRTTCKRLDKDSRDLDSTARACHNLKTVFSDHGLVGKARNMYVQERRIRSLEAKMSDGWFNRRYLGSLPSRIFTGYGVQIGNLVGWMILLFVISTGVYVNAGVESSFSENVSYSVLAFTVAPPRVPSGTTTQVVMMIETFFGTLSIVLMGYILGNRERF